jgi:drug/metabolite transporter (DMT)-like permease
MHARPDTTTSGIALCLVSLFMFASQDAVTKFLVADYEAAQFVMIRFWVFAFFATALAIKRLGLRRMFVSKRPFLQIGRSLLLVVEIVLFASGLRYLGLADMHASFTTFPLLATAMAPFILGEHVGWRRWSAVAAGFVGAMIIIRPGMGVFQPAVLIPLLAAFMFALYHVLTRLVSRHDHAVTSLIYVGWVGAMVTTPFGLAAWQPPTPQGWLLMGVLSVTGLFGHMLLILALECAPSSALQPLNYLLLIWAMLMGFVVFGDLPDLITVVGASVIVGSGLYAMFRERTRPSMDKKLPANAVSIKSERTQ